MEETLIVPPGSVSHLTSRQAINSAGRGSGREPPEAPAETAAPDNTAADEADGRSVVVISAAGRRMGIIVDTFVRRQEW